MEQKFSLITNTSFTKITFLFLSLLMALSPVIAQDDIALNANGRTASCPDDPCPCRGNYSAIQVYYFGTGTVDVSVYKDLAASIPIVSFSGVAEGQLLTIDGASLPNGRLGYKTYLFVTDAAGETCVTKIHTSCPSLGWPGSSEDLKILGETFGDFTVYSRTDSESNFECDISNVAQDWHVGGNIIGPSNNTLGTRNGENLVFITHDIARGTITNIGDFGINTLSPAAQLDVQGDVIINETLDVNGITRVNDISSSASPLNGALIVAGGAGVGENLNVGNDANIGNDASVGNDLSVVRDALIGRNLQVAVDATIINDLDVGNNTNIGNDLDVAHNVAIGNDINVNRDAQIGRNITVSDNATIGQDLDIGNNTNVGNDLSVNNNASITNLLQVGQNATIGQDVTIGNDATVGNDLDVSGDAHVDGIVTIGTSNTPNMLGVVNTASFQLFVDGGILTEEVLVRTGWADYVFETDYKRLTLEAVEKHIATHGHLPNTPSAQEITENGLSLGETTVNQQEKIEELFLYVIEMNKDIKALQKENQTLRTQLQSNK